MAQLLTTTIGGSLTVNGNATVNSGKISFGTTGILIASSGSSAGTVGNGTNIGYSGAAGDNLFLGYNGGSNYMYVTTSSTSWSSPSDKRDKTDIENIDSGLALTFINRIEPKTYVFNYRTDYLKEGSQTEYDEDEHLAGSLKKTRRNAGILAQDVYEIEKEVLGSDNYCSLVDHNNYYGDLDTTKEIDRYFVRQEQFIPFLIGSIKELTKRIEALETEVKELKEK